MQDRRNYVYSRQYVVDRLRHLGFSALVEDALHELPEQVDDDELSAWGMQHGVTRDKMISDMGGSP
jgi:hypothetical protein